MQPFRKTIKILVFCIVLSFSVGHANSDKNPCNKLFCIADAFGVEGNQSVVICAGTDKSVNSFNIWYNNTGPFNLSNGITTARYFNPETMEMLSDPYSDEPLNSSTSPSPCVIFVLNGTKAPFTTEMIQINVTAYGLQDYNTARTQCNASGCNATMITANYISLEVRHAHGAPAGFGLIAVTDSEKRVIGEWIPDYSGYWAQHCLGIVSNGECLNETEHDKENMCVYHGKFPFREECKVRPGNAVYSVDFVTYNISSSTLQQGNNSLKLDRRGSPTFFTSMVPSPSGPPGMLNITRISVYDESGKLLFSKSGENVSPVFILETRRFYRISAELSSIGERNYTYMVPYQGMVVSDFLIPNETILSKYTTVKGRVVDEDFQPVKNAVVYAYLFGFPAFGISVMNSSVTDENGKFSMRLPSTIWIKDPDMPEKKMPYPLYQFYVVHNSTSSEGALKYFPTTDNNDNRGYMISGEKTILKPFVLKKGGEVRANITLNGANFFVSELSILRERGDRISRKHVSSRFGAIISRMLPPYSLLSIPSPVTSGQGAAILNIIGRNISFSGDNGPPSGDVIGVCTNTSVTVEEGKYSDVTCNLTAPGFLNLTVVTCEDIFSQAKCWYENTGDYGFWFDTVGIIRDNKTGKTVLYLDLDGMLLEEMIGNEMKPYLLIPLEPGNYTAELISRFDYSQFLNVYNGTPFEIKPGEIINLTLVRAYSWKIHPMLDPSFSLKENNFVNVSVFSPSGVLTNESVSVTGRILFLNRSPASDEIRFEFDSSIGVFYNLTLNLTKMGVKAGKYWLLINARNVTATHDVFSSVELFPITASDFRLGIELGGFAFGSNEKVTGKIFAYDSTGHGKTNTTPVKVKVFDEAGNEVDVKISVSEIKNGEGRINITMPKEPGFYEILVIMNASNELGMASRWVEVTDLSVKLSTDKPRYGVADTVNLLVEVSDALKGKPVSGASVEVTVDNEDTPAIGFTHDNGKALISLDPKIHSSGNWSVGWHTLRIKISKESEGEVTTVETWYGFEVVGMDVFIRGEKASYSQEENVSFEIFAPCEFEVESVKVDGTSVDAQVTAMPYGSKRVELGNNWAPGYHDVEFSISSSSGTQTFHAGFEVRVFNVKVSTEKFVYAVNSLVPVRVKVSYPNGTAAQGIEVNASLYLVQGTEWVEVSKNSSTTDSKGEAVVYLNASKPGFNRIAVNVSGQIEHAGIQVSSVEVTLLDPEGAVTNGYVVNAGEDLVIRVNASLNGESVPDNSTVRATLWMFGSPVELPANSTENGNATIVFRIPENTPAETCGLEVRVITPSGDTGFAPPATVRIAGEKALKLKIISRKSFLQPYAPGEAGTLIAVLTLPNGTGVAGRNVTFEIGSRESSVKTLGCAQTGEDGIAMLSVQMPDSDGFYFVHAYLSSDPSVQDYAGIIVSSIEVEVTPDKPAYTPGENITLSISVRNRSSGAQVNATGGFVILFNERKGEIHHAFSPSGSQPYTVNITIPNETDALGVYPLGVVVFSNTSQGFGFALVDVVNTSETLELSLPSSITAGMPFFANITASTGSYAELRIFSPAAREIVYENTSVPLQAKESGANASVSITLPLPGVYVFAVYVEGIGERTKIVHVSQSSGAAPAIWTGKSPAQNATSFSSGENVYVISNTANSTAVVITRNPQTNATVSFSIPLNRKQGSVYYGVIAPSALSAGEYFVRLDTPEASGVATTIFRVV